MGFEESNEQPEGADRQEKQQAVHPHLLRILDQVTVQSQQQERQLDFCCVQSEVATKQKERNYYSDTDECRKKTKPQQRLAANANPCLKQ